MVSFEGLRGASSIGMAKSSATFLIFRFSSDVDFLICRLVERCVSNNVLTLKSKRIHWKLAKIRVKNSTNFVESSSSLESSVHSLYRGGCFFFRFNGGRSFFRFPLAAPSLVLLLLLLLLLPRGKYQIRLALLASTNIRRLLLLPVLVIQFSGVLGEKENTLSN